MKNVPVAKILKARVLHNCMSFIEVEDVSMPLQKYNNENS